MTPGKQLSYIKPFNEVLQITEQFLSVLSRIRKNVTALLTAAEIIVYYLILVKKKKKDCLYFYSLIC